MWHLRQVGADGFVRGVRRVVVGYKLAQLVVVGVFLLAGPWWTLGAGLPGAAVLLAGLGLLFDWRALAVLLAWLPVWAQRVGVRLAVTSHLAAATWAAMLLIQPVDPAWTALVGTEDWSDPRLAFAGDGALVVLAGSGRVHRWTGAGWQDLGACPGGFAWEFHGGPDGALWSAPRDQPQIARRDPETESWQRIDRPPGDLGKMSVGSGELLVQIGGLLHRYDMFLKTWSKVQVVVGAVYGVALGGGSAVALGSRWWSREAGQWIDVTPPGELGRAQGAVGGGGWRYAASGGLWSGDLRVARPGQKFQPAPAPATDVRVLAADPVDGRRVVAGSWGQGVWFSEDGGQNWAELGLQRVQVRSLVVDWSRHVVCAGSSNLIWNRGVLCRDLPHGQPSGAT